MARGGGRSLEGFCVVLQYLKSLLFVCMESIVEVVLIIVQCRVGRCGVNMDVPEGDKASLCGWKT
jgi:hypothetical protein